MTRLDPCDPCPDCMHPVKHHTAKGCATGCGRKIARAKLDGTYVQERAVPK